MMVAPSGASWSRETRLRTAQPGADSRAVHHNVYFTHPPSPRRPRTFRHPSSAMSTDTTAQESAAAHGTSRFVRSVLCDGIDGGINALDTQATTTEPPSNATAEHAEEEETPALPPRLDSRADAPVEPSAERGHETPAPTENEHPQVALLRGMFPDFDPVILYAHLLC